ncbi:acyloxyacyl hydrolase [Polaribacter butkevichii]|uniref:acyloxyacyl hydrolase n=1 Tax=Polaribacter butkevichii TaxID=218490 RepID=UPI000CF51164|nr:acyloxyacyl hydrolase [Polaribacter butkevichii]
MKKHFFILLFFIVFSVFSQEKKVGIWHPTKVGFLYNKAQDNNFLFDDKDYSYTTETFKAQLFYDLGSWKKLNFEISVQPQIQTLKHQLINEQFVLPSEENYQDKRTEFTTPKTMHLYAFELGFILKKKLLKKLDLQAKIGLGVATINTRTERLAKGFTFIENGSLGFSYKTTNTTFLYIGTNIGHVSNFDTQDPNNGYNILGYEIGFSYLLK